MSKYVIGCRAHVGCNKTIKQENDFDFMLDFISWLVFQLLHEIKSTASFCIYMENTKQKQDENT